LPNVGGLILGSNQAGQWIDLAVDPVYKVSDVLNQTIVAYSYYVPNEYGGSFDGACDVTGFSETATITTSPVDYAENTTWAVVRIPMYETPQPVFLALLIMPLSVECWSCPLFSARRQILVG